MIGKKTGEVFSESGSFGVRAAFAAVKCVREARGGRLSILRRLAPLRLFEEGICP